MLIIDIRGAVKGSISLILSPNHHGSACPPSVSRTRCDLIYLLYASIAFASRSRESIFEFILEEPVV